MKKTKTKAKKLVLHTTRILKLAQLAQVDGAACSNDLCKYETMTYGYGCCCGTT